MSALDDVAATATAISFAGRLASLGWKVGATRGLDGQPRYQVSRIVQVSYQNLSFEQLEALTDRLISEGRSQ